MQQHVVVWTWPRMYMLDASATTVLLSICEAYFLLLLPSNKITDPVVRTSTLEVNKEEDRMIEVVYSLEDVIFCYVMGP